TSVIVVTGHRRSEIEAALDGLALTFVNNPVYANGMASSLIAGFSSKRADGADGLAARVAKGENQGIEVSSGNAGHIGQHDEN
ncbi:hypothetical protein ACC705_35045, partial [Rhizobium ruizarguesonis]